MGMHAHEPQSLQAASFTTTKNNRRQTNGMSADLEYTSFFSLQISLLLVLFTIDISYHV